MREKESNGELLLRNEALLKTGYNPEAEVSGDGKKFFSLTAARVGNAMVSNQHPFYSFPFSLLLRYLPSVFAGIERIGVNA